MKQGKKLNLKKYCGQKDFMTLTRTYGLLTQDHVKVVLPIRLTNAEQMQTAMTTL